MKTVLKTVLKIVVIAGIATIACASESAGTSSPPASPECCSEAYRDSFGFYHDIPNHAWRRKKQRYARMLRHQYSRKYRDEIAFRSITGHEVCRIEEFL
jgi:hypothetical protein